MTISEKSIKLAIYNIIVTNYYGGIENSIDDGIYTFEEIKKHFPFMLDSNIGAESVVKDIMNNEYIRLYDRNKCIETKHLRFLGKETLIKMTKEMIEKDFPYSISTLGEEEQKRRISMI